MKLFLQTFLTVAFTGHVQCIYQCTNCLYGPEYCDPYSYRCTYGCKPGWKGPTCTSRCYLKDCFDCADGDSSIEQCTSCNITGQYGPLCNLPCSANCLGDRNMKDICDFRGNCLFGCKRLYSGSKCDQQECPFSNCQECSIGIYGEVYCWQCSSGYYWQQEQQKCLQCSNHCLNGFTACDPITGACSKCETGWFGERCQDQCNIANCSKCTYSKNVPVCGQCIEGMFPDGSGKTCKSCESQNCNGSCSSITGYCPDGCKDRWYGKGYACNLWCSKLNCAKCALTFQNEELCYKCNPGYYVFGYGCEKCPESCLYTCESNSAKCVDGCKPGLYGEMCQYLCNENCLNHTCDGSTGHCECQKGWFGPLCDRTCPVECTDCRGFNLTGVCGSCEAGKYGKTCELACSENCQSSTYGGQRYCDQDSGMCTDGCSNGFYGDNCNLPCGQNCESLNCARDTGYCLNGCTQYYYGKKCEVRCPENCKVVTAGYERACKSGSGECMNGCSAGFYGMFCNSTCSSRCKDNTCEQNNGDCSFGCKQGFTGTDCTCGLNCNNSGCDPNTKVCSSGCLAGWYGATCEERCGNCLENVCHQNSGFCVGECARGYGGDLCQMNCPSGCLDFTCNKEGLCSLGCIQGYYGAKCQYQCPSACANNKCQSVSGLCYSCEDGKYGDKCDQEMASFKVNKDIVIGSSLSSVVVVIIIVITVVCWLKYRSKGKHKKSDEPVVIYRDAGVTLEQLTTSQADGTDSDRSDMVLLGERSKKLLFSSDNELRQEQGYTLYRGEMVSAEKKQDCVIKLVKLKDIDDNKVDLRRLMKETEIHLLVKSHINIVQLLMSYQNKDVYCAALELCVETGLIPYLQTLSAQEEDGLQTPHNIFKMNQFCIDICSAVCYIHKQKVIHRMLQTCHVYVNGNHIAKLGDFYWASVLPDTCSEEDAVITGDPLPENMYHILSPEAVMHERFSFKSDIWCLGLVFWEIFTYGKQPFEGTSKQEYIRMLFDGIRLVKPGTAHIKLFRLMRNCWHFSPEDRPTAEQVLRRLLDIQGKYSEIECVMVHV